MLKVEEVTVTDVTLESLLGSIDGIRDLAIEANKSISNNYLLLSKCLFEIFHGELYRDWGYSTFSSYIDEELDFGYRKAQYLVEIWGKVALLKIPNTKLLLIGWTKMAIILKRLTPETLDFWLDKAANLTVKELTQYIIEGDEAERNIETSLAFARRKGFTLRLSDSQIIIDALEEVMQIHDTLDIKQAVSIICQDWLRHKEIKPKEDTLDNQIEYLEKMYGVKLAVVEEV